MDYNLVKKLVDAGFKGLDVRYTKDGIEHSEIISFPSLEALIKACGDTTFFDLIKLKDKWVASDHYHKLEGSTPNEAVANLYLALYGKDGISIATEGTASMPNRGNREDDKFVGKFKIMQ